MWWSCAYLFGSIIIGTHLICSILSIGIIIAYFDRSKPFLLLKRKSKTKAVKLAIWASLFGPFSLISIIGILPRTYGIKYHFGEFAKSKWLYHRDEVIREERLRIARKAKEDGSSYYDSIVNRASNNKKYKTIWDSI